MKINKNMLTTVFFAAVAGISGIISVISDKQTAAKIEESTDRLDVISKRIENLEKKEES